MSIHSSQDRLAADALRGTTASQPAGAHAIRSAKRQRRLGYDHAADPRCRLCSRLTVLRFGHEDRPQMDTAVLCRAYPKDDPRNELPRGRKRNMMTCWKCANDRHREFEGNLDLAVLHMRSGRYPSTTYFVPPTGREAVVPHRSTDAGQVPGMNEP